MNCQRTTTSRTTIFIVLRMYVIVIVLVAVSVFMNSSTNNSANALTLQQRKALVKRTKHHTKQKMHNRVPQKEQQTDRSIRQNPNKKPEMADEEEVTIAILNEAPKAGLYTICKLNKYLDIEAQRLALEAQNSFEKFDATFKIIDPIIHESHLEQFRLEESKKILERRLLWTDHKMTAQIQEMLGTFTSNVDVSLIKELHRLEHSILMELMTDLPPIEDPMAQEPETMLSTAAKVENEAGELAAAVAARDSEIYYLRALSKIDQFCTQTHSPTPLELAKLFNKMLTSHIDRVCDANGEQFKDIAYLSKTTKLYKQLHAPYLLATERSGLYYSWTMENFATAESLRKLKFPGLWEDIIPTVGSPNKMTDLSPEKVIANAMLKHEQAAVFMCIRHDIWLKEKKKKSN
eukprot:Filipodium_phascolosomae@DN4647_c0_g1_i1.p1